MVTKKTISGFSKLSKRGKIRWLVENFFKDPDVVMKELKSYWLTNESQQEILDGLSENTISNFHLPFSVAPNFLINGKMYAIPMVIEESSVVAAASSAAKFWLDKGGFKAEIIATEKIGHIHFYWTGNEATLRNKFELLKSHLISGTSSITKKMRARGGGILNVELITFPEEQNYYQLFVRFNTCDSMGANFINTVLEHFAKSMKLWFENQLDWAEDNRQIDVIMSILSNYTPNCIVKASVQCPIESLGTFDNDINAVEFAERFRRAVRIAELDVHRATTHNKGIMNGIDAVVLATGNDFRAVEACAHAYASRTGQYKSLSSCEINDGQFIFSMEFPISIGTVGGLTKIHPIAKRSLELLGHPSAEELMQIIVVTGLAQNFSALKSLTTSGIQKGHMKMHLSNILLQLKATADEKLLSEKYFSDKIISFSAVENYLSSLRNLAPIVNTKN